MSRPTTERIMVEQCESISVSQINGLPTSGTQWERTTATLTNECPTCGSASQFQRMLSELDRGRGFLCPQCKSKVVKLYRPPGVAWNHWKCQRCHRLGYSTQYRKGPSVEDLNLGVSGFG